MNKQKKQKSTSVIDEANLAASLQATPDFFSRYPDVLTTLDLPDDAGTAISLHQYQVRVLQAEKEQLKHKLTALVANAKTNHKIHSDLLGLSGQLVQLAKKNADDEAYLAAIKRYFALFEIKIINVGKNAKVFTLIKSLLGKKQYLCDNKPKTALLEAIFEEDAPAVLSVAIVPLLKGKTTVAYLALAADDADRFRPGLGGEFLSLLARLISTIYDDHLA